MRLKNNITTIYTLNVFISVWSRVASFILFMAKFGNTFVKQIILTQEQDEEIKVYSLLNLEYPKIVMKDSVMILFMFDGMYPNVFQLL